MYKSSHNSILIKTTRQKVILILYRDKKLSSFIELGQAKKLLVELRAYVKPNKPQFQEIIFFIKTFTKEAETLLKEAIQY